MKMLGAKVVPATSGSKTLKDATNEAMRDWINNPVDTHYIIGSVVGPILIPKWWRSFNPSSRWKQKNNYWNKPATNYRNM